MIDLEAHKKAEESLKESLEIERTRMGDANARIRELRAKLLEERAKRHNDRAKMSEATVTLLLSLARSGGVLAEDIRTMIAAEIRNLRARNRFRSIAEKIRKGER